jgi:hypothetical protein
MSSSRGCWFLWPSAKSYGGFFGDFLGTAFAAVGAAPSLTMD